MTPPDHTPAAAPRLSRDPVRAGVLVRRDAFLMPFTLVSLGAIAFFISQLLRPTDQLAAQDRTIVLVVALCVASFAGVVGAATAVLWDRVRFGAATVLAYAGATALLAAGVTVAAVHDGGLASISMLTYALLAPFVALVLPARLSLAALVAIFALMGVIDALEGGTSFSTAALLVVLIAASYVAGLLPRRGMVLAGARAVRFARSDALTGLLNRRGFEGEADHVLAVGAATGEPVALLMIDLNDFKLVNDRHGHAAGDELLAWVGERLAALSPARAVVGRTGGDEFTMLLPGADEARAEPTARVVHAALAERVGASIGVAARADGASDRSTLLREADAALYDAKADATRRVEVRAVKVAVTPAPAPPPALTFGELQARRGRDEGSLAVADPLWLFHGHLMTTLVGAALIAGVWLWGGESFWLDWFRWAGLAWLALSAVFGVVLHRHPMDPDHTSWPLLGGSTAITAFGMMNATLAFGGPVSAVAGAFVLASTYDATIVRFRDAARNTAILACGWLAVVVLAPQGTTWAVPFELMLFVAALGLGTVCRRALVAATNAERQLATTDPLTGLLNRQELATRARAARAQRPGDASAVLALDLDGFKAVNDQYGHAAGDRLLDDVAGVLRSELGDGWLVGRVGGDEFMAFAAHVGERELRIAVDRLDLALRPLITASIGTARFGVDGNSTAAVAAVADARSYARKQQRRAARSTELRSA